jgi:hypothetical protein
MRSEYQPERRGNMGRLFLCPSMKKSGNIRDKSGPWALAI